VSQLLWIAAGGALGSVARHGMNIGVTRVFGYGFPWGILAVNVLGSFLIGVLSAFFLRKVPESAALPSFLTMGFLGGFTTFSAFALDVAKLIQSGENNLAAIYALASVLLSVLAVFAGFMLLRAVAA
jgi:fluoride exporter